MNKIQNLFKKIIIFYGLYELLKKQTNSNLPSGVQNPSTRDATLEAMRQNYQYKPDVSEQHLSTIQELSSDEQNRHNSIENKIGNVVTQSGLVFSIIAVIFPIFNDIISNETLIIKVIIFSIFLLTFISYLISILFATQIFGINRFIHIKTSPASVIDSGNSKDEIIGKRVKDLIYQYGENKKITNKKANILIYANRWFVSGFILSGLLILLISVSFIFLMKQNKQQKEQMELLTSIDLRLRSAESVITSHKLSTIKVIDSIKHDQLNTNLINQKRLIDSLRSDLIKVKSGLLK